MIKNSRFSRWSNYVLVLFVLSIFLTACSPKATEKTTIKVCSFANS